MKYFFRILFLLGFLFYGQSSVALPAYPIIVKVGIHLLSIDQLDLYKGIYAMDFHLLLQCNQTCPAFNIEVENGTIQSIVEEKKTSTMVFYRMKASLQENFDAKSYPFDVYDLRIVLKDQKLGRDKLIFMVDPKITVVDPHVILHGWNFDFNAHAKTENYLHPLLKQAYSRYIFTIELVRPPLMGVLKVIFPAIIIIFFAFISFFVRPHKAFERFGIVSSTLLGSVIFHLNITSSLPPLGYLTFVDTLMIINYTIIFLILFENVYMMRLTEAGRNDSAKKIDKISIVIILTVWLILQFTNIILYFGPSLS